MLDMTRFALPLLTASLVLWAGCGRPGGSAPGQVAGDGPSGGGEALARVSVVQPQKKTLIRRTEQPGQVRALEETPIFAKVSGFVRKVYVDIGDRVQGPVVNATGEVEKLGQILLEIEAQELHEDVTQKKALIALAEAQVTQADSAIKVAQAAKQSAQSGVAEAEATAERTEAQFTLASSEMERARELLASRATTQKLVDEAQNRLQAAAAARKETAAKIASARGLVTERAAELDQATTNLRAAQSRLEVARADERRAETMQSYLIVRAPYDGIVTSRAVDPGHLVQPGKNTADKPLLVVVMADTVRVQVDVPESDATLVELDSEVLIRVPAMKSAVCQGAVKRTAWVLQPTTRTLRVEVDVPNPDGKLRPGMYVYADLKVAERKDAIALPKKAILTHDQKTFCLVVDADHRVVRTEIATGIQAGDDVEVVSGLTGGESVIAANVSAYRDGQQVEVVDSR